MCTVGIQRKGMRVHTQHNQPDLATVRALVRFADVELISGFEAARQVICLIAATTKLRVIDRLRPARSDSHNRSRAPLVHHVSRFGPLRLFRLSSDACTDVTEGSAGLAEASVGPAP